MKISQGQFGQFQVGRYDVDTLIILIKAVLIRASYKAYMGFPPVNYPQLPTWACP